MERDYLVRIVTVLFCLIFISWLIYSISKSNKDIKENYHPVRIQGEVIDVRFDIGGINIQNAWWAIQWENGEVTKESCSRCLNDEIPLVGERVEEVVLVKNH